MFSFLQAIIRETIHICCIFCWNLLIFKFIIWTNFVYEASVLVLLKILFSIKILFSAEGIIITGGGGGSAGITSVEVILSNSTLCTLPPLPEGRYRHSQSGLTACGGHGSPARGTCTTLSNGVWATSHSLDPRRKNHVSWNSPSGLMLFGGHYSMKTTALLSTTSSSSSAQFDLLYDTK